MPFPSDSVYAVGGEVLNLVVCMRRREFIATLGGAVAFPLAAHAQTERTRRIGALVAFAENDAEGQVRVAAFRRRLQELGSSEGHNLQIDFRYVGGDVERMRPAAAELVALTPDVIFVHTQPALPRYSRSIAPSRPCSRRLPIRSAAASSTTWHIRAATSPGSPFSKLKLAANGWTL